MPKILSDDMAAQIRGRIAQNFTKEIQKLIGEANQRALDNQEDSEDVAHHKGVSVALNHSIIVLYKILDNESF